MFAQILGHRWNYFKCDVIRRNSKENYDAYANELIKFYLKLYYIIAHVHMFVFFRGKHERLIC